MYVWGRMARAALTQRRRGPYHLGEESRLSFRCLPTDIDPNLHLNNARYMMLADVGRIALYIRLGLFSRVNRRRWATMMGGLQSVYVREIRLWKRFDIVSSLDTFEDLQLIGRHRFVLENGETAALVTTTAGVYDRDERRFVPIGEVMEVLGEPGEPPRPPSEQERAFMASHAVARAFAKYG
jgi:acyl-CoA thioesterase FadM